MKGRAFMSILVLASACVACVSHGNYRRTARGILEPESARMLMAVAQRIAVTKLDMNTFSYSGRTRVVDFEGAWVQTERTREADGADSWQALNCSSSSPARTWRCSADKHRTVQIEATNKLRGLNFEIGDDMSGELAVRTISPVVTELLRTEALKECSSGKPVVVPHSTLLNHQSFPGVDGRLYHEGDEWVLHVGLYLVHFDFGPAPLPEARLRCWDLPDVLE